MVNKRVQNSIFVCYLKNDRMISIRFQGKPFNITVIQVYVPTSNTEEAEVEPFYEDLQDLLELTPKKDVLFIIGDWNAKVGSQETPGVTPKITGVTSYLYLFDTGAGSAAGGWPGLDISSGRGNVGQRTDSTSNRSSMKPFTPVFAAATVK